MNGGYTVLLKVLKWIGLGGGLVLLGLSAFSEPADLPLSAWNGPVFVQDHWELTGIVEHGVQTHHLFEQELDLVEVRYGHGSLWARVGIVGKEGMYESLMSRTTNRQDVAAAFQQPRYITLSIPGSLKAVDHTACAKNQSARCQVTALVEGSRPPLLLDPEEEPTGDLSNVFIQSGVFPPHYQYGFLTWDILPGRIIEQGLEGG
jgi:hypothetical protein